ncbi:MAG: TetR/AcrR family transcriptional regulator [Deltaproteobacteria bacterium]|nr:TetR/AcrR family transcriptional regulator [Deltaproteobacteria bacterium]
MRKKGVETRREIVTKSMDIFSIKGYFNTSINDILEATQLTKGGLYGHYRSKEAIWDAAYEEASKIWQEIVYKDLRDIEDPLKRIERFIENDMRNYLGADVFPGGCFFLRMLVDLSGQSEEMNRKVWIGFEKTVDLLASWLDEAKRKGLIRQDLNHKEISNFIIITLNGAATLYASSKDPSLWQCAIDQLRHYMDQLRLIN